jgi:hypothetical protein
LPDGGFHQLPATQPDRLQGQQLHGQSKPQPGRLAEELLDGSLDRLPEKQLDRLLALLLDE